MRRRYTNRNEKQKSWNTIHKKVDKDSKHHTEKEHSMTVGPYIPFKKALALQLMILSLTSNAA